MSIHLYCVLPAAPRASVPPAINGVAGSRVRALETNRLVAWVSDIERGVPVTVDGVKAHDAVVHAALDLGSTPVPARFGQRFDDDQACLAALANRAPDVEALLATMQGTVEMTLLITPSTRRMLRDLETPVPNSMDAVDESSGRRYLEGLKRREEASEDIREAASHLAAKLSAAAFPFVLRAAEHQPITRLPMVTISHLITRECAEQYRAAVEGVDTGGELRVLIIGPRAPYSFCALGGSAGMHGMKLAD